jgi:hypothetical protein
MRGTFLSSGCLAVFFLLTTTATFAAGDCESGPYPRSYDCYVTNYNFGDFEDKTKVPQLTQIGSANLSLFIEVVPTVASKLPPHRDLQLVAWWTYIENILGRHNLPWAYSYCEDGTKGKARFDPDRDCEKLASGYWQVGYGVQVAGHIDHLPDVFRKLYPQLTPKEVGDLVLTKCGGCSTLDFPDLDLDTLTKKETRNKKTNNRRNRFWASILMRDRAISAYLAAETLYNSGGFPCYGKIRTEVPVANWCSKRHYDQKTRKYGTSYVDRRKKDSEKMLTIIDRWRTIPSPPQNF